MLTALKCQVACDNHFEELGKSHLHLVEMAPHLVRKLLKRVEGRVTLSLLKKYKNVASKSKNSTDFHDAFGVGDSLTKSKKDLELLSDAIDKFKHKADADTLLDGIRLVAQCSSLKCPPDTLELFFKQMLDELAIKSKWDDMTHRLGDKCADINSGNYDAAVLRVIVRRRFRAEWSVTMFMALIQDAERHDDLFCILDVMLKEWTFKDDR